MVLLEISIKSISGTKILLKIDCKGKTVRINNKKKAVG